VRPTPGRIPCRAASTGRRVKVINSWSSPSHRTRPPTGKKIRRWCSSAR